jgi:hypothetical protein
MEGRTLPDQVADEVVQARDCLLVGDPFGDPPVVLDLRVDFFALLAHAHQRAHRSIVSHSAQRVCRSWQGTPRRGPHWAGMDKFFLAIVASAVIVLIAAAVLFVTARKETTRLQAPYPIRQQRP